MMIMRRCLCLCVDFDSIIIIIISIIIIIIIKIMGIKFIKIQTRVQIGEMIIVIMRGFVP